jgi:hypothetical protein
MLRHIISKYMEHIFKKKNMKIKYIYNLMNIPTNLAQSTFQDVGKPHNL